MKWPVCVCMCPDLMINMGYSRKEIEESLLQQKYNDIMATYLLLGRRGSDVSCCVHVLIRKQTNTIVNTFQE